MIQLVIRILDELSSDQDIRWFNYWPGFKMIPLGIRKFVDSNCDQDICKEKLPNRVLILIDNNNWYFIIDNKL